MIDWNALDMEVDRERPGFERRMEATGGELCERLEQLERSCKEAEEARRRKWEKFEGRMMTDAERHRFELDGIRRVSARMTEEYVRVINAAWADLKQVLAEARAESRAQTEAIFKLLDRLPPG